MTQESAGDMGAEGRGEEGFDEPTHPWVYIVDDEPAVRRYLQRLIQNSGYRVKLFASADEFLQYVRPEESGCLVLDMCLPGMDGLALQDHLAGQTDLLPIVFISGYGSIRSSVTAMKSGAVDFLTKPLDGAEVLAAIARAVAISGEGWERLREEESLKQRVSVLTHRELEVIRLVAQGRLNREIAVDLGIAEKTVKVHRGRAMHKLGATSSVELPALLGRLDAQDDHPSPVGSHDPRDPDDQRTT